MSKSNVVFGIHAVKSTLETHPHRAISLYCSTSKPNARVEEILSLAKKNKIAINSMAPKKLDAVSNGGRHQGVVLEVTELPRAKADDLLGLLSSLAEPAFLLILDGVQDPHNLGACLRTADAAGVHAVIAPKDNSVGITATVSKVASGAVETVPFFQVTNLARTMEQLKEAGIWIMGSAGEAESCVYQGDFTGPVAMVMGSEGKGMRRLTRDKCDHIYHLPMNGSVESLNVSVATGLFIYEVVRQRRFKAC